MKSYKELIVWQKSFELTKEIYKITVNFPREELYGLVSQMRRATLSIPSNIAEGFSRSYTKEFVQFLKIAFGSGAELETQLLLAKELKFLRNEEYNSLDQTLQEIMKMLNKMISTLKNSSH